VFKFITARPFWVNLLVAIVLAALLVFGFLQLLGLITKHGEYLTVPNITGKNTSEAIKILEDKGFDVVIQDSVYTDTASRGTVLKQLPDPNSTVKVNRSVLLIVNRVTLPMVDMPSLQGKSLNYALELLKRSHLNLGDTTFRPDFMMGSVLEQHYHGTLINPGAKIQWGSKIDLIVGGGLADQRIPVPDLLGMTFTEAKSLLEVDGVSIGAIIADAGISDTAAAFIYKQNPPRLSENNERMFIQSGQVMDLWLSATPKVQKDTTTQKQ